LDGDGVVNKSLDLTGLAAVHIDHTDHASSSPHHLITVASASGIPTSSPDLAPSDSRVFSLFSFHIALRAVFAIPRSPAALLPCGKPSRPFPPTRKKSFRLHRATQPSAAVRPSIHKPVTITCILAWLFPKRLFHKHFPPAPRHLAKATNRGRAISQNTAQTPPGANIDSRLCMCSDLGLEYSSNPSIFALQP
jgi:hypothetical protein